MNRRAMMIGLGACAMTNATARAADLGARIDAAVAAGELDGLHGLVVQRGGRVLLERYYSGQDWSWGEDLGQVTFGPDTLHDLRSVTKSIVALLYGVALAEGKVPPPEAVLIEQFPAYPDLAADPARRQWRVAHALGMTLGIEWNENLPYTSAANSEIAMEMAADRIRFVLERPIVEPPGRRWHYCGGATALIGHLIARGTGVDLADYARRALLAPLGIDRFGWLRGGDGTPSAASGLRLAPRDLARLGQLVLQRGAWQGRTVVPAAWIDALLQPRVEIEPPLSYGWHWYLGQVARPWVAAFGNGGQRLYVAPGLELAVAISAGNYNKPDQGQMPLKLWRKIVLPGVAAG